MNGLMFLFTVDIGVGCQGVWGKQVWGSPKL